MPDREKLLERARQNPKNISFDDLCQLYRSFGFIIDTKRGKGSHVLAKFPGNARKNTIPRKNPVRRPYVKQAIEFIEEIQAIILSEEA